MSLTNPFGTFGFVRSIICRLLLREAVTSTADCSLTSSSLKSCTAAAAAARRCSADIDSACCSSSSSEDITRATACSVNPFDFNTQFCNTLCRACRNAAAYCCVVVVDVVAEGERESRMKKQLQRCAQPAITRTTKIHFFDCCLRLLPSDYLC